MAQSTRIYHECLPVPVLLHLSLSQFHSTMATIDDIVGYDEQQCFKIQFNEVEYYARLPRDGAGFYLLLWSQGELHGNGLCTQCCECKTLPIIEFGSTTFYASLRSSWDIMPAVLCRLPASAADRHAMSAKLKSDLGKLGGSIGPCQRLGLMTGGGLPHGSFANAMRSVKGVDAIMKMIWALDGRLVPGVPYVKTRQAVLLAKKKNGNLSCPIIGITIYSMTRHNAVAFKRLYSSIHRHSRTTIGLACCYPSYPPRSLSNALWPRFCVRGIVNANAAVWAKGLRIAHRRGRCYADRA